MKKKCVDLRPICERRRWVWQYDECFHKERIEQKNKAAPWYVEIVCKHGTIYPRGGSYLLACVEDHPIAASRLLALGSSVEPHQGNVVYRFPLSLLDAVIEILKPKKKPGRAATQTDKERLAQYAFQGRKTTLESSQIQFEGEGPG